VNDDLPKRLRELSANINYWDYPITAKEDCLIAAAEIEALREKVKKHEAQEKYLLERLKEEKNNEDLCNLCVAACERVGGEGACDPSPPKVIYLQWWGEEGPTRWDFPGRPAEVSWCAERVFDGDIVYIRADDDCASLGEEVRELRKKIEKHEAQEKYLLERLKEEER